jgi:hypothetical protein
MTQKPIPALAKPNTTANTDFKRNESGRKTITPKQEKQMTSRIMVFKYNRKFPVWRILLDLKYSSTFFRKAIGKSFPADAKEMFFSMGLKIRAKVRKITT